MWVVVEVCDGFLPRALVCDQVVYDDVLPRSRLWVVVWEFPVEKEKQLGSESTWSLPVANISTQAGAWGMSTVK